MNDNHLEELVDLYVDGALPTGLQAYVHNEILHNPVTAADVQTLQQTDDLLKHAHQARPTDRFVDRTLRGLLFENATSCANARTGTL